VIVRRRRGQRADTPQSLSTEERQRLDQLLDKNQE
jgi:cytochrome c-type biogenesis protein CcmH